MARKRVLKFGGAALRDGPAIERVTRIVREHGGDCPVLVVSAHEGITDMLENAARGAAQGESEFSDLRVRHRSILSQLGLDPELCDRHHRQLAQLLGQIARKEQLPLRDLDLVLSFGERISARIVARALECAGQPATPVDAYDLGFRTDSNHGSARPLAGIGASIREALADVPGIPIVTGFLAHDSDGNLTTLGRNGSDLTASVLAEALAPASPDSVEIQFWKCVPGILTADPDLVPDARRIPELTYEEAAECAFHGSRILHPASVAPAIRGEVAVRVLDVRNPEAPGTRFVTTHPGPERTGPLAIATKSGVVRLDVVVEAPGDRSEIARRLFATLDEFGVLHGLVSADGSRLGAVVDPGPGLPGALDALERLGVRVHLERDLAVVAVVGSHLPGHVAAGVEAYDALRLSGVDVVGAFLGDRERSQAFLLRDDRLAEAARTLHAALLPTARGSV